MQVGSLGQEDPWRRAWHPTPVFLPGESHGKKSLVGYSLWGWKESGTHTTGWGQEERWASSIRVVIVHTMMTTCLIGGGSRTSLGCPQKKGHRLESIVQVRYLTLAEMAFN